MRARSGTARCQPAVFAKSLSRPLRVGEDTFRSGSDHFFVDGVLTRELPFEQLTTYINGALGFYGSFVDVFDQHRTSYHANEVVLGGIAGDTPVPIELLADAERGLFGFQSPRSIDEEGT